MNPADIARLISEDIRLNNGLCEAAVALTPEQLAELQARWPKHHIINPWYIDGKLSYTLKPMNEPTRGSKISTAGMKARAMHAARTKS